MMVTTSKVTQVCARKLILYNLSKRHTSLVLKLLLVLLIKLLPLTLRCLIFGTVLFVVILLVVQPLLLVLLQLTKCGVKDVNQDSWR